MTGADPEVVAARRQFSDQVRQALVVRVTGRGAAQQGESVVGGLIPVAPEVAGVPVQEQEPGVVRWLDRVGEDRRV